MTLFHKWRKHVLGIFFQLILHKNKYLIYTFFIPGELFFAMWNWVKANNSKRKFFFVIFQTEWKEF